MATVDWEVSGLFTGNCSCDHLTCPCPSSNYVEKPTYGWCKVAFALRFDKGHIGGVRLDDRAAILVISIPGAMADGNWSLGILMDDRVTPDQQQGLTAILSGQVGGPLTMAASWIGKFLGVELRPIRFEWRGKKLVLQVPGAIDIELEPTVGDDGVSPVTMDNVRHPANTHLSLAKGLKNHIHAFGIDLDAAKPHFSAYADFHWKSD